MKRKLLVNFAGGIFVCILHLRTKRSASAEITLQSALCILIWQVVCQRYSNMKPPAF
jgi:hypothetical protein